MEKLEVFYSKFFSALYIHFTVWADCVGESEIACLATLITLLLLYVSICFYMFLYVYLNFNETVSNLIRFLFVKNYLETLKPQALYQRLQINQDCVFFFFP